MLKMNSPDQLMLSLEVYLSNNVASLTDMIIQQDNSTKNKRKESAYLKKTKKFT